KRTVAYTNEIGESHLINIPMLVRRDWALDAEGNMDPARGLVREVWYLASNLPENAKHDWIQSLGDIPPENLHPIPEGKNTFDLDKGVEVHFNSLDPDYVA